MQHLTGSNNAASLLGLEEEDSSTATSPSPNNPTIPYTNQQQRDNAGGSALLKTLDRNKGEGWSSLGKTKAHVIEKRKMYAERDELASKMHRKWQGGDVYAPHDLSYQEQKKWIKPKQPSKDVIDMLGLNPLDHYKVRGWS